MKYKFKIMTNYPSELELEIEKFNATNNSDLKLVRILDDEVTFVELETSMTNELLFKFGVEFGRHSSRKNIEQRI